jgi:hypothetical protein
MHFNLFTLPIDQEPVPSHNTWLTNGFMLVDNLLSWCEARHLYLILDMHACPGGEGHDRPIADYNPPAPSLWENAANCAKLVALWQQLAARYANRTGIGGYDLMNEPNWEFENHTNNNGCDDETNAPLRRMLVDITAAIRQVDTNHIIFLEGNCWCGNYHGLLPPWDDNLVISFHKYWDAPTVASLQSWTHLRTEWNMPLWLGESGENQNDWFRDTVRSAEQVNLGWSWWPWKKIGTISGPVMIQEPAAYQAILDYWRVNGPRPTSDDAFQGLLALARAARLENCVQHPDVIDALMRPVTGGVTLPFKSNSIPGTVFAVDYDMGRIGESYFDTTTHQPANRGNRYRNDAVDIEACNDAAPNNGYDLSLNDPGDWQKFTVAFPAGPFALTARVAGYGDGGQFHVEVGTNVVAVIKVPNTGGWQSWKNTFPCAFTNAAPAGYFRVVVDRGGYNLNWLRFSVLRQGAAPVLIAPETPNPSPLH